MIYKLTALVDLKYRLRERPTQRDGYFVKKGDHIFIVQDVLKDLCVSNKDGSKPLDSKAYKLERHA